MKALIVEDSRLSAMAIKTFLKKEGIEVVLDAKSIKEIAEKILDGRRLKARTKMLGNDVIEYWREEAKKI